MDVLFLLVPADGFTFDKARQRRVVSVESSMLARHTQKNED